MSDTDLIQLYSKRILALAADVPHFGRLEKPQATATRRSPLCGSTVTVDLVVDAEGRISDFAQDVKACALGQASAAVLGQGILGRTAAEVTAARDQLKAMLKDGAAAPTGWAAGLEVLTPAREYKNRHASILLAWEATVEALANTHSANTH